MNNSQIHKLTSYFSNRVLGIKKFLHLIEKIEVFTEYHKSYGNSHYRIFFNVDLKKAYDLESEENKLLIDSYFSNQSWRSGHKFISYLLSSRGKIGSEQYQRELIELKTFYDCYTTLTLFLISFIESELPDIKINIQNLDNLDEFKLLNNFLSKARLRDVYERDRGVEFAVDKFQDKKLKLLDQQSCTDYEINKSHYYVNDDILLYGWRKSYIRSFVIDQKIPIKFRLEGNKEIMWINAPLLKQRLSTHVGEDWLSRQLNIPLLLEQIDTEKRKFKRKNKDFIKEHLKVKRIGIFSGDILYLKNKKLVKVKEILCEKKISYKYIELTEKLTLRKKGGQGIARLEVIDNFLPLKEYEKFKTQFQWQHVDLAKRFIKVHGVRLY